MNRYVTITRGINTNKTTPDVVQEYFYRVEKSYVVDTVFNEMTSNWVLPSEFDQPNMNRFSDTTLFQNKDDDITTIVMGTDIEATVYNISITENIIRKIKS